MSNINTEYELFVREIYDFLHKAEGVENLEIRHNVSIQGRTGAFHQIDVYWKFKMAGIIYQVAVECKNYKNSVSIGKLRDFHSVLEDIGNINGIFVAKHGFQSGAKQYAKSKNIKLMEIRHPEDEDWKGRIRDIHFQLQAAFVNVTGRKIQLDDAWMKSQTSFQKGDEISFHCWNHEIFVENREDGTQTSFYELEKSLPAEQEGKGFQKEFVYADAYLTSAERPEKFKLKSVVFTYDVFYAVTNFEILGDQVAKAIVRDVLSGQEHFVDIYGHVSERRGLEKKNT